MASTTAYPPSVILPNSSKPVSLSDAQQILATYLTRSETNPHLHPDALLQPSGPTFSAQGGPQGGLVLHQLRRVEAGLRGEILKPEPKGTVEKESDDTKLDSLIEDAEAQMAASRESTPIRRKGGLKRKAEVIEVEDDEQVVTDEDDEEDTQEGALQVLDSDGEVNVADGAETGEIGDRSNVVQDGGEIPEVQTVSKKQAEKDAKKAAKREKKRAEKAAKAAQRENEPMEDTAPVTSNVHIQNTSVPKQKHKKDTKERKEKKERKQKRTAGE